MEYIIDNFYELEVDYSTDNPDYFNLKVFNSDDYINIPLKKLPFQKHSPYDKPSSIICRVKTIDKNGIPVFTPSIASYVKLLYKDIYAKGESFECRVISAPDNPSVTPYVIEDKNGIFFRVFDPDANLSYGQLVNYKFTKLTDRYFSIKRADDETKIKFFKPEEILKSSVENNHIRHLLLHFFNKSEQMESARKELNAGNAYWIISCLKTVINKLPEWFLAAELNRVNKVYSKMLSAVKDIVLYLLEGSSILSPATPEHRRVIQILLTDIADGLEPYEILLHLIRDNGEDKYVRNLLDKLQESGYLYHPARQFAVLMLIFRRHPDKVEYYLSQIFESIFGRDLENWNREPFKSAFIEQFQIYVQQKKSSIDSFPVAESREQKAGIENVILAVALQHLLNPEDPNYNRQWALFYRCIALLRPLKSEDLLTKSFISLMGAELQKHFTYSDLKQPIMMITSAMAIPCENPGAFLSTTHRYSNRGVEIAVSSEGLTLQPEGRRDITERVIPGGLMPWLNPQIIVNGVRGLSGTRIRKLSEHNSWWHEIEVNLFEQGLQHTDTDPKEKIKAAVGNSVYIVIDSISDSQAKNPTFNCHISDTEYADGKGLLKRENIVAYGVRQVSMRSFMSDKGTQLGFLATVINIDDDGNYEFSLLDEVNRYAIDNLRLDEEYQAVITIANERTYAAISDTGVGLLLEHNPRFDISKGSIVKFRFREIAEEGKRIGYITGLADDEVSFDQSDTFAFLLEQISVTDDNAEENNDDVLRDMDEVLSEEDIREIIEIIRIKAIAETDLIKAYDYLRLARIFALTIQENILAEKLLVHATLLSLHQFFATNSRIDAEKLEELRTPALADPLLRMIFHRLELVSWLGAHEKTPMLYETVNNPTNELEGDIARMVLAYNLIQSSGGDSSIANDIKQKIMEKLNVNNETRKGKFYGSESKYIEFKTSIIFRPGLPGEDIKEDPAAQQFHILSRIAGLMNANGGRLYLGVNNDGFEVGLHDDFKYFERHSVYAKTYEFKKINTLDKLAVFLEELINQHFDRKFSRKIEISVDEEAEKGVIVFNVEQSLEPVFLDGRLFVRQSGQATREYRGQDIEDFVNERTALLNEHRRKHSIENENRTPIERAVENKVSYADANTEKEESVSEDKTPVLATSVWRPNVRHNYEPGYITPYGYLYFRTDNSVMFSKKDKYMEPGEEECTLALVISHELANECLILGYENERVLKLQIQELIKTCDNSFSKFNDEYKLMFAGIAKGGDGLLCVAADGSENLSKRVVPLSDLSFSRMNNKPKQIHDATMKNTVLYEIVDESSLDYFEDCMAEKMSARRFGMTMRCSDDSSHAKNKLTEIQTNCAPQN